MQGLDAPATSRANSFATLGSIGTPSISTTTTTVASNSSVKSKSRFGLKSKLSPLFRTSSAATTGTSLTFSSLSTESSGTPSTTTLNSNGERQKKIKSYGGGRRYVKTKAAATSTSSLGSQPSVPQVPQLPKPIPMEETPSKTKAKIMGGGRRHVKTTVQPTQRKIIVTEPIVEKKVKTIGGGRRHVKPRKKDNLKTPEIKIVTTSTEPVPPSSPPALTSPITLGLSEADPFASSSLGAVPYLPTPPSTSPLTPSQVLPPHTSPSPVSSLPPATLAPEQPLVPVRYSAPVENPVAGPSTSPSRPLRPLPQPPRPPQLLNNPSNKVATPTRTAHLPPSSFHRLPPSPSSSPSMLPYLSPDSEPEALPESSYLASRRRGYSASQAIGRQAEEIPLQNFSQPCRPVTSTGLMVSRQATIRSPSRWQRSPRDRYAIYPPPPPYSARPEDHQDEAHMQTEVEYLEDQTRRLSMLSVDSSDTYCEGSLIPLFPTPHPLPPVAPLRVRASVDRSSAITPLHSHSSPVHRREPPGRSSQLPRRPRTAPQPSHELLYMRRSVDDRDYRDVVNDILLSVEAEEQINLDEVIPEENELDSDESDIDPMMSLRPGYRRERQRARHMERMAMYTNGTLNPGGRARPDADAW